MRHLGSLLLSLLLAPVIWLLTGVGLNEFFRSRARLTDFGPELALGLGALLAAGLLYAVLVLPRLSPIGPALAGLAYLGMAAWSAVDGLSLYRTLPRSFLGAENALTFPAEGYAALLAMPLLGTLVSPSRWRRHDRVAALYAGQPHAAGQPGPAGMGHPGAVAHPGQPYPGAGYQGQPYQGGAPYQGPQGYPGRPGQPPPGLAPPQPHAAPQPAGPYPPASPQPAGPHPPAGPTPGGAYPPAHQPDPTRPDLPPVPAAPGWSPPSAFQRPVEEETTTRLNPGSRPPAVPPADRPTEDLGGDTRPLAGTPPPSAAYPPPGHATPTAPPVDPTAPPPPAPAAPPEDPDATRRL